MRTKNIIKIATACLGLAVITSSCTNLDEELYGRLSPDNYYQTEEEGLSSVAGIYTELSYMFTAGGDGWRDGEFDTDECACPGRASGGWYDEDNMQMMSHNVKASNGSVGRLWSQRIFRIIGAANAVMASLQESPNAANMKGLIAETRALRAYGYWFAMDYFGNVPIFTAARVSADSLPATKSRAEVYKFVVSEFTAAAADLPSVTTVTRSSYYPRFTKEAIYTALASVYLNAEVYTGTADWADVITMCDNVINTGAYSLQPSVGACFLSTNENNSEIISAFSISPTNNAGQNQFILYAQPGFDKAKYSLGFSPANGYCFTDKALNRYEAGDARLSLLEYGPQYNLDGTPLCDASGKQYVLTTIKDMVSAQDNEGYRVLKYSPVGATWSSYNADNDLVMERYANVLLMKAEAEFRLGKNTSDALNLVNQIRKRSNCSEWSELSLKKIEEERAREFIWEGQRRRDMIRFGSYFTDTWFYKETVTPAERGIYPIPEYQLNNNPNLKQNTGY
jgi:hypothetical protein